MDGLLEGSGGGEGEETERRFRSWCVGNTGSKAVDRGMRRLWAEGWMPRNERLLCAACLVEGLGVDWRRGRDWFKHTLVDYDESINEMMWQNAGMVGVDPFYRGLKWEEVGEGGEDGGRYELRDLILPKELREYAEMEPDKQWVDNAKARRDELKRRGVYRAGKKIVNSGVRVAWPGLEHPGKEDGDVWGVGRTPLEELDFEIEP
ncbi:hypothetical protein TrRE_jg6872 [Triparma retinervis]|uniref:Cryptochrome/DNA photolyase FAD-binding domain-containing protein n=1 Tax=Triparma retinervis TaxID=2557542 RepID=A0A9W7DMZ6_9STRA|nr:hypothetical protein TrRE_jg6872 [Triparma retinervis]